MKKVSAQEYAEILQALTAAQKSAEQSRIIGEFIKLLARRGQLKLAPQIILELEKLGRAERGETLVEVASAHELSAAARTALADYLKQNLAGQIVWQETVEASLVGGAVLQYNDKIIDASLKTALGRLQAALTK